VNRNEKLALCGILISFPLSSCTRVSAKTDAMATDSIPVRAVRAVSQDIPLEIIAVGNVEAINSVAVKSRIAGQIKRVTFEEGQSVAKGQLLFAIDQDTLQRQAVEQRAELERDAAVEQQARAVVARDSALQKQSQSEADIARKLGTLGVLSGQRVDQLVTSSDTATAALLSDQAGVEAAVGTTKADRARLSQTQLQLSFTEVVSPIAGRAGAVMVKAGNMVRDNDTTLVYVLQLAPVYITFGVPEQSLPEVQRLNTDKQLTVEASNGSGPALEGHLVFIDNAVDETTGTIRLKAIFPNTDKALWPGEFVNVRLRLQVEKRRTLVPDSSIQAGLNGKYVWLAKSGIARMAPVTVLRNYKPQSGPELAVVSSGINPGDMIVSEGQLRLTDGARISLLNTPGIQPPNTSTTEIISVR
jgi:membrane fusion protein, multidrug efflux system